MSTLNEESPKKTNLKEGQSPVKMTAGDAEGKFGQSPVSAEIKKGMTGHASTPVNWNNLVPIGGGGTAVVGPQQPASQPPVKAQPTSSDGKGPVSPNPKV
jgi:hypothetical protein